MRNFFSLPNFALTYGDGSRNGELNLLLIEYGMVDGKFEIIITLPFRVAIKPILVLMNVKESQKRI